MFALVLTMLAIFVVLAFVAVLAMLFDVALGGGRDAELRRRDEGRRWTPPFVSGRDLFHWARGVAQDTVSEVVGSGATADTPRELIGRLDAGVARAMLPDADEDWAVRPVSCPPLGQGVIGVTAPEAIAIAFQIAEALRRSS